MKLAEKTDVIKASPAIQVQSKITHLQRRAWNVLLANAYDELPTHEKHSVRVVELAEKLDFDSKNDDYLKDALEALVDCKVKWNVLNKDKKLEWGVASLLAEVKIIDGVCSYAYSPTIREQLHNPRIYAKINLRLQNRFKSKYALILWELAFDYFDESRKEGETPFIPLDTFRELMGIDDALYPEFKKLNKWVIKDPLKEINNEATNFLIEVEYKRGYRRKVVAVKFRIQKLKKVSQGKPKQGGLFPEYDDMEGVLMELYQAGISSHEALKIYNQGFNAVNANVRPDGGDWDTYLQEKIDLMKAQPAGSMRNKSGFLRRAIEENWSDEKINKRQETKKQKQIQSKIDALEEKIQAIQREWADKSGEITGQIIEENPDIIQKVSADLLQQQESGLHLYYRHSESSEENYKRTPIAVQVNVEIRKRHANRYAAIEKEYSGKIKTVETKIDKLRGK